MGAAIDRLFRQGVKSIQACGFRRTFTILTGASAGLTFVGTIVISSVVDADMPLGQDIREGSFLDVLSDVPLNVESNDRVSEGGTIWKLVKRVDNPVDVEARYEVVKVIAKDT
jgi:hypothetical protein